MDHRVRHVHASRNQWVSVHRNQEQGPSADGSTGGSCGGGPDAVLAVVKIVAMLAVLAGAVFIVLWAVQFFVTYILPLLLIAACLIIIAWFLQIIN